MSKHILVALPLTDALQQRLRDAVPSFVYRFTTQETATLEEILWADAILGNVPVELIRQNHHLEWFQSNFAGPDPYLAPGVLPQNCAVTNATGAYGLAISEWMLGMWLALIKDLLLYRDLQTAHRWDPITRPVRSIAGARVLCVGMGDIGSSFARRAHALGGRGRRGAPPCGQLPALLPARGRHRQARRRTARRRPHRAKPARHPGDRPPVQRRPAGPLQARGYPY